jgi:hypothetical protein
VSSSTLRVLILRYNTHLPVNFGWLCDIPSWHHYIPIPINTAMYLYINTLNIRMCVYIYIYAYIPQSTTIFLTVWFFKTLGCCHLRYALLVPKAGRPRRGFQLRHGTTCS